MMNGDDSKCEKRVKICTTYFRWRNASRMTVFRAFVSASDSVASEVPGWQKKTTASGLTLFSSFFVCTARIFFGQKFTAMGYRGGCTALTAFALSTQIQRSAMTLFRVC